MQPGGKAGRRLHGLRGEMKAAGLAEAGVLGEDSNTTEQCCGCETWTRKKKGERTERRCAVVHAVWRN